VRALFTDHDASADHDQHEGHKDADGVVAVFVLAK